MLLQSAEQFEHYRELAMDNEVWLVPGKGRELDPYNVRLMANDSCIQLARVYEKLALIAADVDHDFETSYQYYVKAHESVQKGIIIRYRNSGVAIVYECAGDPRVRDTTIYIT